MSFTNLFGGGNGRRRPSLPPSNRPATPSPSQSHEARIGSRLNRYTAQANDGLDSAFVPEELGDLFASSRLTPYEATERERPL